MTRILQELEDHRILILDFKDFDQNFGAVWVGIGAVSIDVFVKILVSMQGRKENLNPKKRERELYSRLKSILTFE